MSNVLVVIIYIFIVLITLSGLFFVSALLQVAKKDRKSFLEMIIKPNKIVDWYKSLHKVVFHELSIETLLFNFTSVQHLLRLIIIFESIYFPYNPLFSSSSYDRHSLIYVLEVFIFFFTLFCTTISLSDLLPRIVTLRYSQSLFTIAKSPGFFITLSLTPLSALVYFFTRFFFPTSALKSFSRQKMQLIELIEELEDGQPITQHDKRLISSVFDFRHRIAREIMKPRVEIFSIPESMSIEEASRKMLLEGYSRVPVYQGSIDTITGILFYKDLLSSYMKLTIEKNEIAQQEILNIPVTSLMKKVFYCPETKKISSLLQEFRKKQMHLAVIVDEYGGTSGVVTIEDILEEIVGEIADEYDDQEILYKPGPKGSWIVDAQMNLHDIAEEIGIEIPQGDEYDTIAGYIFFRLGSIPKSGTVLHHDHFELKILKSNDRMVEEVIITPLSIAHMSPHKVVEEGR